MAAHRRQHDVEIVDRAGWALLIADLLTFLRDGCDYGRFVEFARELAIDFTEAEAMAAIRRVARVAAAKGKEYQPFNATAAGRLVACTAEDRWAVSIVTIGAIDETREEAIARRKEEKRAYECERSRRRRAAAGATQRPVYEANSTSAREPWKAEGVSRATWYRRKAAANAVAPPAAEIAPPEPMPPPAPARETGATGAITRDFLVMAAVAGESHSSGAIEEAGGAEPPPAATMGEMRSRSGPSHPPTWDAEAIRRAETRAVCRWMWKNRHILQPAANDVGARL